MVPDTGIFDLVSSFPAFLELLMRAVSPVVTPGATSAPALIWRSRGLANFRFVWVIAGCCLADTLLDSAGSLQKATSVSLATNSADGNSSDAFLPSLIPHRWSKWR